MTDPPKPGQRTLDVPTESQMYRDYERAFTQGTGLPLRLQGPTLLNVVRYTKKQENPFCALLSKSDESCSAGCSQCYALQCEVEAAAEFQPKTLKCFAGLCETAVPVRVGANVIAFLHTGQVLLQRPDKVRFKQIAAKLLKWGSEVDLKKLEEHYLNTRVLTVKQYEALIRLLVIFAHHLAACGNALALHGTSSETPAIEQARSYIRDHSDDELSLTAVAQTVNMSATYFSAKFKEMAGINPHISQGDSNAPISRPFRRRRRSRAPAVRFLNRFLARHGCTPGFPRRREVSARFCAVRGHAAPAA